MQNPKLSRVVIVDALRLRRAGVSVLLKDWAEGQGLEVMAVAPSGLPDNFEEEQNPRLLIMSVGRQPITEPEIGGVLRSLESLVSAVPLVFLSDRDESADVIEAFQVGASGFLPTSMDPAVALRALTFILHGGTFFPAVALLARSQDPGSERYIRPLKRLGSDQAENGENGLTNRQRDVANLLRQGLSNKLIARQLDTTEATVKMHVRQVMRKLGASNRTQAALLALRIRAVTTPNGVPEMNEGPMRTMRVGEP
jgi:DNA-binding NarL/FixJ family response regulator